MTDRHALAKFAAFTVLCLLAAGWLVAVIGNVAFFADRVDYRAEFEDVRGLVVNDAVKVAGVAVGKVTGIDVERGNAVVSFEVDDDLRLGHDTTVEVRWRNSIGLRYLYLHPGGDGALPPGHRFALQQTSSPVDLNLLLERVTPVMRALDPETANIVVRELATALSGNEQEVRELVSDAGELFDTLGSRSEAAGRVIRNGAELMEAYAGREEELRDVLSSFADLSESVAARNDVLLRAIDELADVESELARLLEENDPELRTLIDELDQAAAVLSVNHDEFEEILRTTGRGIVPYHLVSRWGQWFNIRVPGLSEGERTLATERGATLPPRGDGDPQDTLSGEGWHAVFRLDGGRP